MATTTNLKTYMKKSAYLAIATLIVIIAIVVVVLITGKSTEQTTETTSSQETIMLMGIEMTEEQAVEHCQVMPDMDGCAPYIR